MNTNLQTLSIADLKAALDFITQELSDMRDVAKRKDIDPGTIPTFAEKLTAENKVYNELLNRCTNL